MADGDVKPARPERQKEKIAIDDVMQQLLAVSGHQDRQFVMHKHKTGKPYGFIDDTRVGVSVSHCHTLLICALHTEGEVGIDVEPCERKFDSRLRRRISHPDEQDNLPDELSSLRLWTIKEAALKYLGTGLRMAMNKIKLEMADDHLFRTNLETCTITVASFRFRNHWIAVAYNEEEL